MWCREVQISFVLLFHTPHVPIAAMLSVPSAALIALHLHYHWLSGWQPFLSPLGHLCEHVFFISFISFPTPIVFFFFLFIIRLSLSKKGLIWDAICRWRQWRGFEISWWLSPGVMSTWLVALAHDELAAPAYQGEWWQSLGISASWVGGEMTACCNWLAARWHLLAKMPLYPSKTSRSSFRSPWRVTR